MTWFSISGCPVLGAGELFSQSKIAMGHPLLDILGHPFFRNAGKEAASRVAMAGFPYDDDMVFNWWMPRSWGGRPIFTKQKCHGASVFGHSGASEGIRFSETWENVGMEGHPFSQNGHPFDLKPYFGGHQAQPVAPFKILKDGPPRFFGKATIELRHARTKQFLESVSYTHLTLPTIYSV